MEEPLTQDGSPNEAPSPEPHAPVVDAGNLEPDPAEPAEDAGENAKAASEPAEAASAETPAEAVESAAADSAETPAEAAESAAAESAETPAEAVEATPAEPAETPAESAEAPAPERKPKPPAKPRDPAVIRAFRGGHPIDGTIEKIIKGGYEIRVGKSRGFCPHSQMDLHRVDDPEEMVGKTFAFRILQLRRGGEDVVVSRRALLEAEHADEMKAVRATLIEGAVMTGRVTRLADFGAFIDLGAGVTGLAHVTELAHGRVVRAGDVVAVGDRVPVKITKLDETSGKISLSIRQAITDPWESVPQLFEIGRPYPGKVKRIADFGAFVELRRGIEALAPAREFPPTEEGWRDGLETGKTQEWVVIAVDAERRRITVVPAFDGWEGLIGVAVEPGAKLRGRIVKAEVFGVFVWLGPGRVGMIPRVWSGAAHGPGFERRFPAGSEIAVEVVDVQEGGKRIRLAVEGVDREAAEAARSSRREGGARSRRERRESSGEGRRKDRDDGPPPPSEPAGAFGSHLGDALRAALGKLD